MFYISYHYNTSLTITIMLGKQLIPIYFDIHIQHVYFQTISHFSITIDPHFKVISKTFVLLALFFTLNPHLKLFLNDLLHLATFFH
jgi:hypothetical protein